MRLILSDLGRDDETSIDSCVGVRHDVERLLRKHGILKPKAQHKGSARSVFSNEIQELKDVVAAQQEQIKQLQEQISTCVPSDSATAERSEEYRRPAPKALAEGGDLTNARREPSHSRA